jgi:hypothetical protein
MGLTIFGNTLAKLTSTAFLLSMFSVPAFGSSKPKFSEIPDSWLSGSIYTNEALGIKFQLPDGWAGNTDGETAPGFDYHTAKEPARQCVKVLMSYSVAGRAQPEYKSKGLVFVLDPGCFPGTKFPRSMAPSEFRDLAGAIIHAFSKSPYIGPDGADVGGFQQEGLFFLVLTGAISTGPAAAGKASVHENMLLTLTEFNGYWIGWGSRADDERTAQLKGMTENIKFWMGPKGKMP